jgi:hypothetical protein
MNIFQTIEKAKDEQQSSTRSVMRQVSSLCDAGINFVLSFLQQVAEMLGSSKYPVRILALSKNDQIIIFLFIFNLFIHFFFLYLFVSFSNFVSLRF